MCAIDLHDTCLAAFRAIYLNGLGGALIEDEHDRKKAGQMRLAARGARLCGERGLCGRSLKMHTHA